MDISSFLILAVVALVVFAIARFVLRLTARIVGCVVMAIVVVGVAYILLNFFSG